MHPLLKSPKNLIVVCVIWSTIILGFAVLYSKSTKISLNDSIIFVAPLMIIELFLSLSTWYFCKNIKLEIKKVFSVIVKHIISALVLILFCLKKIIKLSK